MKKKSVFKNAGNLYNTLLAIYFNNYNSIRDKKIEKTDKRYDLINLFLKDYKYDVLFKNHEGKSTSQEEKAIAGRVKLRR